MPGRPCPECSPPRPGTFARRSPALPPIHRRGTQICGRLKACRTGSVSGLATGACHTYSIALLASWTFTRSRPEEGHIDELVEIPLLGGAGRQPSRTSDCVRVEGHWSAAG